MTTLDIVFIDGVDFDVDATKLAMIQVWCKIYISHSVVELFMRYQ